MVTIAKAFAYITRTDELLVFEHVAYPEAGIQVPAGTVRPGELPRDAALREAREETGLPHFTTARFLGSKLFDARPYGKDQLHQRHFFHVPLTTQVSAPRRWRHFECDPSDGASEAIEFELYWIGLDVAARRLSFEHGALLERVTERSRGQ